MTNVGDLLRSGEGQQLACRSTTHRCRVLPQIVSTFLRMLTRPRTTGDGKARQNCRHAIHDVQKCRQVTRPARCHLGEAAGHWSHSPAVYGLRPVIGSGDPRATDIFGASRSARFKIVWPREPACPQCRFKPVPGGMRIGIQSCRAQGRRPVVICRPRSRRSASINSCGGT
jgi:hypothetical protein